MGSWIVCCRASTLRAVVLRTAVGKFDLGLGAPALTQKMVKIVVEDDAGSTADPDVLVDVRQAGVSICAGLVGEQEVVTVDLKLPHPERRTVVAVSIEST